MDGEEVGDEVGHDGRDRRALGRAAGPLWSIGSPSGMELAARTCPYGANAGASTHTVIILTELQILEHPPFPSARGQARTGAAGVGRDGRPTPRRSIATSDVDGEFRRRQRRRRRRVQFAPLVGRRVGIRRFGYARLARLGTDESPRDRGPDAPRADNDETKLPSLAISLPLLMACDDGATPTTPPAPRQARPPATATATARLATAMRP